MGLDLAWAAGATLADLEFVQFHPTALALPDRPAYLLSEALRGEGALLVDEMERPIVDALQPRDVVARAIARHLRERGPVFLSLRQRDAAEIHRLFPAIAAQLHEWNLDLARDLLPVAPAAHYCMGGVRSDRDGRSDVPGLYVAGEVACTGVQGANRLASNSLLECLVFGRRAALAALADAPDRCAHWQTSPLPPHDPYPVPLMETICTTETQRHGESSESSPCLCASLVNERGYADRATSTLALGAWLDRDLGVERDEASLADLVTTLLEPSCDGVSGDLRVAALAARAALLRRESRGAHYRADTPALQPGWQGRIHWRQSIAPSFERIAS